MLSPVDKGLIEKEFLNGFARVAKVILSAGDYDALVNPKLFDKADIKPIRKHLDAGLHDLALNLICSGVEKARTKVYRLESGTSVIFFGNTQNNIKELEFFRALMKFAPAFNVKRLEGFTERDKNKGELDFLGLLRPSMLAIFEKYNFTFFLVRQLIIYLNSFLDFYFFVASAPRSLRMLVVANDHSPEQVSISTACKIHSIKRVYLQHAAVSPSFSALDFDYALLYDKDSEKQYLNIGKTECRTLIVQRMGFFDESRWVLSINSVTASDAVNVVIYPTAVYNAAVLIDICKTIRTNSSIKLLGIKYHPRCKDFITSAPSIQSTPDVPHIAIIGNSSVALELIHSGNIVYLAEIDDIPYDYYRFVQNGLCLSLGNSSRLKSKFWVEDGSFFRNNGYREKLKKIFAENKDGKDVFLKRIYLDTLGGDNHISPENYVLDQIVLYPGAFFSLASKNSIRRLSDLLLIKAYDSLFAKRVLQVDLCCKYLNFSIINSITQFWFFVKRIEWNGFNPGEAGLSALYEFILTFQQTDRELLSWVEVKFFTIILRYGNPERLVNFLNEAKTIDAKVLHPNYKVALVRFINKFPKADLGHLYSVITADDSLTGLARLKVAIQSGHKELYPEIDDITHYSVEKHFVTLIGKELRVEYKKHITPFFSRYKKQAIFIDINHADNQREALVDKILEALHAQRPFSLVRLGDGEGYFFSQEEHSESLFKIDDVRNRERHWWGEEIPSEVRAKIVKGGIKSIMDADIIGIPTIFRFLRDTPPKSKTFLTSLQARGLLSVLNGIVSADLTSASFTDSQLNIRVFSDASVVNRVAAAAKRVVIVNGALKENLQGLITTCDDVVCIEIPTHAKQKSNNRYVVSEKPLPYCFESVLEKMILFVQPGTLVLVGGGVIGKSFVSAAKSAGGCAIDVGSAFDQLTGAGIHSLY